MSKTKTRNNNEDANLDSKDFHPNMATMPVIPEQLLQRILPSEFSRTQDLDKFIKQCQRYFDIKGISRKNQRKHDVLPYRC